MGERRHQGNLLGLLGSFSPAEVGSHYILVLSNVTVVFFSLKNTGAEVVDIWFAPRSGVVG